MDNKILAHMKRALYEDELREMAALDKLPEPKDLPSVAFIERLNEVKRTASSGTKMPPRAKRIAIIAAAALLLLTLCACMFWGDIVGIIEKMNERNTDFYILNPEGAPKKIETVMAIYDIPEGVELVEYEKNLGSVYYHWSDGERFCDFNQMVASASSVNMDTENSDYFKKEISGYTVYCNAKEYHEGEGYHLGAVWTDNSYLYSIYCSPGFEWQDVYDMIASLSDADGEN